MCSTWQENSPKKRKMWWMGSRRSLRAIIEGKSQREPWRRGMLCVRKGGTSPDWRSVIQRTDTLRLSSLRAHCHCFFLYPDDRMAEWQASSLHSLLVQLRTFISSPPTTVLPCSGTEIWKAATLNLKTESTGTPTSPTICVGCPVPAHT